MPPRFSFNTDIISSVNAPLYRLYAFLSDAELHGIKLPLCTLQKKPAGFYITITMTKAPYNAYYTFKGPPYACKAPPPHQFIFLVKFCHKATTLEKIKINLLQILFFLGKTI
jgi:hypothetical protein